MKNKIVGVFICMLVMTAAVVSATGIMNIATPTKIDKHLSTDTLETESNEKSLIKGKQDDSNPPQPLATKTGYLSIPPAAFTPYQHTSDWFNSGYKLTGQFYYIAPVYLLNGATVTKVTFYWSDSSTPLDGELDLYRNNMDGTYHQMAFVSTSGNSGNGVSYDDTIDYPLIDNSINSYYLSCYLSANLWLYGVIIEYNYEPVIVPENMINEGESQVPNMVNK